MADNHKEVDETLYHARQLMEPVRRITVEFDRLESLKAIMAQMIDNQIDIGDPPDATLRYAKMVELFGVKGADQAEKLASAKLIYDELNSMTGNSAALKQFLAIMG